MFIQCVDLVIFMQMMLRGGRGGGRSNLFRVGLQNYFKQLIGNLSLLCAFKMLSCQNFRGPMYPLKNLCPLHFALCTLKNMSGSPGNIQHCAVSYNTSCKLTVQLNSD